MWSLNLQCTDTTPHQHQQCKQILSLPWASCRINVQGYGTVWLVCLWTVLGVVSMSVCLCIDDIILIDNSIYEQGNLPEKYPNPLLWLATISGLSSRPSGDIPGLNGRIARRELRKKCLRAPSELSCFIRRSLLRRFWNQTWRWVKHNVKEWNIEGVKVSGVFPMRTMRIWALVW